MRKLQQILWATDFHPASATAGKVVADLAWRFDSRIAVFHVAAESGSPVTDDHRRELGRRLMEQAVRELVAQKVEVSDSSVVTGSAADRILRKADELNADLIVLGSGNLVQEGRKTAGQTAMSVIQHSHRPVMAVVPGEPTPTFRRILCPIDFSETSQRGVQNAVRLASAFRGQLVVGTVFPAGGWMESLVAAGTGLDVDADVETSWQTDFDTFVRRTEFGEVDYVTEFRRGHPHEQIVAMAKELGCDVIVMGATGRSGLVRLLMGSVTRRVLQALPCSIVIVHDEDVLVDSLSEDDVQKGRLLYAEAAALLESCMYEEAP